VTELSPAEITWQLILVAKDPEQIDTAGSTTKLAFTDSGEVS